MAGLFETIPELAAYEDALFEILKIVAVAVGVRFLGEDFIIAARTGTRDAKYNVEKK